MNDGRRTSRIGLVFVLVPLVTGPLPQTTAQGASGQVFASRTVGVRVDVLVTDLASGRPIGGLTAADFELRDNGVLQKIESADLGDSPINALLALDGSASTAGQALADLQAATRILLDDLRPVDRAGLTTFNHAVTMSVPLTNDLRRVRLIVDTLTPTGGTSLLEGAYAAIVSTLSEPGRSFVLICTDGRDTSSWLRPQDVIEGARRANAVVYVVASSGAKNWAPLKSLSEATGGKVVEIESSAQIAAEFRKILQDFRSRYVITFTPAGVERGGFHRLQVRVRRSQMKVTARPGYLSDGAG